jgi:hypothetical protein
MTLEEFKVKYPHLAETLEILAVENKMKLQNSIELPFFLNPALELGENQAAQLTGDEKIVFAMGDDDERGELADRTGFVHLDDLLTECFEGMLTDMLFVPPVHSG